MDMKKFAFTHNGKTFLVTASEKPVAIAIFAVNVKGKHGFVSDVTVDDIKKDIEAGSIEVGVLSEI